MRSLPGFDQLFSRHGGRPLGDSLGLNQSEAKLDLLPEQKMLGPHERVLAVTFHRNCASAGIVLALPYEIPRSDLPNERTQ